MLQTVCNDMQTDFKRLKAFKGSNGWMEHGATTTTVTKQAGDARKFTNQQQVQRMLWRWCWQTMPRWIHTYLLHICIDKRIPSALLLYLSWNIVSSVMVYKALLWDKSYELRAGFRIGILLLNRNYIFVFQEGFPGFHVVIHGYNNSACFWWSFPIWIVGVLRSVL